MTIFDEDTNDRREALFGGHGAVRVWNLLMTRKVPPFQAVFACELEAGGHVGRHRQQRFAEIVIVLEGTGSATVDETTHALTPGAVVHLPLGAHLTLDATSQLRYLIVRA